MVFNKTKKGPRNFQELLKKRVGNLHPEMPQERIAAILERIQTLETEMRQR